jgi:hypothetical protein
LKTENTVQTCTGKNTKSYIGPTAKFKDDFDFAGDFLREAVP